MRGEPIRDDHAIEGPLLFQQMLEQVGVFATVGAPQPVVRAHDAPDTGPPDGRFEGRQICLAQRPLVDLDADGVTLVLLVIAPEVLDACADATLLDALDTLATDTRALIARGRPITEASSGAAASERSKWQLFDDYNARNATAAFSEMEWE